MDARARRAAVEAGVGPSRIRESSRWGRPPARAVVLASLLAAATLACAGSLETVGAALAYEEAPLPNGLVKLDLPYRTGPDVDVRKHRLDLFLPEGGDSGWPTLVFVHGGGWTQGDRAMGGLGIDPIRNLGRFLAARGFGVAVPSYRLQPGATWREQIADVAAAIAWVRREIGRYGGDPDAIHLGGHSAGAWLAAWVGLDDGALAGEGLDRRFVCALVLVSGAAYDIEDEETYALGAGRDYFVERFATEDAGEAWARVASIRFHVDPPVPPTLLLTAEGEPAQLRHQSDLLYETLAAMPPRAPGIERATVPGQNHQRIMVGLSLEGDPASEAMVGFIRERRCTPPELQADG